LNQTPVDAAPPLSLNRMDLERRLSLPTGRFTQPGPLLAPILAALLTVAFYSAVMGLIEGPVNASFTDRGYIPYATVFFFFYALAILAIKLLKIRLQRRPLAFSVVPDDPEFVLSTRSVSTVLDRLHEIAHEPKNFILFNRLQVSLSNLKNIGRVSDVDEILRSRADNDEAAVESSYTILRGLLWSIPVLGFIGTVIGLSVAIGSFGQVLSSSNSMSDIKPALQEVTAGLATAFETTLQALVAALIVQLVMTFVRRSEERMLDEFNDFCDRQVLNRLRLDAEESP